MAAELHAYGPAAPHDELLILGNKEGLKALMATIAEALAKGDAKSGTIFCADGEGFYIAVGLEETLEPYAVPYTDDWFCESNRIKSEATAMRLHGIVQAEDDGDGNNGPGPEVAAGTVTDVTPSLATFPQSMLGMVENLISGKPMKDGGAE